MAQSEFRKVRNAVCSCSTGCEASFYGGGRTGYYETKGHGINAVDGVLQNYDYCIDRDELSQGNRFAGDDGRETLTIRNESGDDAGCLVCVYYRMNSGRYEFTTYIA